MRRLFPVLAVLFVLPLCGSDSPKDYDDKTEVAGIEGTWRQIEVAVRGHRKKPNPEYTHILTFRSGTYTDKYGNKKDQGKYRIDATYEPPYLDLDTCKCIYQLDGDTLKLAVMLTPKRPHNFNDDGVYIYTFKRVK